MSKRAEPRPAPAVFRAVVAVPALGIAEGDDVVFQEDAPRRFSHVRAVNGAGVARAFQAGQLIPIHGPVPAELSAPAVPRVGRRTKGRPVGPSRLGWTVIDGRG